MDALKKVEATAGTDYKIVTVSIDPEETPQAAAKVRDRYLNTYGRENADWQFLVGAESSIKSLAKSVGFGYEFLTCHQSSAWCGGE